MSNQETVEGRQMQTYSDLLGQSIQSMIDVEQIFKLLSPGTEVKRIFGRP